MTLSFQDVRLLNVASGKGSSDLQLLSVFGTPGLGLTMQVLLCDWGWSEFQMRQLLFWKQQLGSGEGKKGPGNTGESLGGECKEWKTST